MIERFDALLARAAGVVVVVAVASESSALAVVCHHGSRCAPPPFAGDIASTFFHAPPSLASRRGFGSTHGGFGLSRGGGALRGVSPASARSDGEPSARRMSSASTSASDGVTGGTPASRRPAWKSTSARIAAPATARRLRS